MLGENVNEVYVVLQYPWSVYMVYMGKNVKCLVKIYSVLAKTGSKILQRLDGHHCDLVQ